MPRFSHPLHRQVRLHRSLDGPGARVDELLHLAELSDEGQSETSMSHSLKYQMCPLCLHHVYSRACLPHPDLALNLDGILVHKQPREGQLPLPLIDHPLKIAGVVIDGLQPLASPVRSKCLQVLLNLHSAPFVVPVPPPVEPLDPSDHRSLVKEPPGHSMLLHASQEFLQSCRSSVETHLLDVPGGALPPEAGLDLQGHEALGLVDLDGCEAL